MKVIQVILAIFFVGLAVSVSAQPEHHNGQLQQVITISGTVAEWTYNDDFEYDGLYLNTGNANILIKFPPHLAQQILALGNRLNVSGELRQNPEGLQELKMNSMSGNGQTIYDQKPVSKPASTQEPFVNGEGKVKQTQINKKGETVGYILENGVIIRIPPHIARQLSQIVQTGATMGYTGFQKSLNPGHVQAFDYKIIRVQTISVNGTQYMIR